MTIREITEEIGALYERMKSAVEIAQADGVPMSSEVEGVYKQNNARLNDLTKMRDQHYLLLDAGTRATNIREGHKQSIIDARGLTGATEQRTSKLLDSAEYRDAFHRYLSVGQRGMNENEQRALSEGTDADGGFLPATDFYATLIQKRLLANAMRQICTVMPLGTFKTDIVIENGYGTAAYTAEAAAVAESTPSFANIVMKPNTMRYFTKMSNELLSDAPTRGGAFSIETILANQVGKVMGEKEEDAFVQGDGSGKPKGILAYTSTISKVTTATNNVIVAQDLLNTVYTLPRQYRANAKWMMTDAVFAKIRQLLQATAITTSGGGAFAPFGWSMGDGRLQDGEPDRLLGYPVVCVAQGPTYPAAGTAKIVAAFGDFSYYNIGDRESVSIKVARETYLANNQTGYFAFARHDGQCVLADAFRHFEIKGT